MGSLLARCTIMQKLLLLVAAALFIGTYAANSCPTCASGASTCTTTTCSGSQLCIASSYVSSTSSMNITSTGCDTVGFCSTYTISSGKCKTITGFGAATKYYCPTSPPSWAKTAATSSSLFPSSQSCPSQAWTKVDASGLAGWVIAVIIISIFVVCCCPLIIFCICCGGMACCIGAAASDGTQRA